MGLEKREIQITKEIDDAMALVCELAKDIKEGKDISAITSENLPLLVNAINGIDQVDDEMKMHRKEAIQTILLRAGDLADAFLPKKKAE
jgi:hypothetical protein